MVRNRTSVASRAPRGLVMTDVEGPADAGVADLPGELDLPLEALDHPGLGRDVGPDGLEGDPVAQLEVLRLVDLPHAALGQEPHDAVPARHDVLRGEQRRCSGPGRAGPFGGGQGRQVVRRDRARGREAVAGALLGDALVWRGLPGSVGLRVGSSIRGAAFQRRMRRW